MKYTCVGCEEDTSILYDGVCAKCDEESEDESIHTDEKDND